MAVTTKKISELTTLTTPTANTLFVANDGGNTYKITLDNIENHLKTRPLLIDAGFGSGSFGGGLSVYGNQSQGSVIFFDVNGYAISGSGVDTRIMDASETNYRRYNISASDIRFNLPDSIGYDVVVIDDTGLNVNSAPGNYKIAQFSNGNDFPIQIISSDEGLGPVSAPKGSIGNDQGTLYVNMDNANEWAPILTDHVTYLPQSITFANNIDVSGRAQITGYLNVSGGITGSLSGSVFGYVANSQTGSFLKTESVNTTQTVSGSLVIAQNLTVLGSASITYLSSSQLNVGLNIIKLNTLTPSLQFGGISIIDSGSVPQRSGSLLFDAVADQWIFVHQASATVTSSVLIMGPETYNSIGNETNLTTNRLVKSVNAEHIGDSNITDTGTIVSINSNTQITGSLIVGAAGTTSYLKYTGGTSYLSPAINVWGPAGAGATDPSIVLHNNTTDVIGAKMYFLRSYANNQLTSAGQDLGELQFYGAGDNTPGFVQGASIKVITTHPTTTTSSPAKIVFSTTQSGSITPVERVVFSEIGVSVTGSLSVSGSITGSFSGSVFGYVANSQTGSFAVTGSNIFIGNQTITGSLLISGSAGSTLNGIVLSQSTAINQFIRSTPNNLDIALSSSAGDRGIRIFATNVLNATPNGAAIQFYSSDHTSQPGNFYVDSGAATTAAIIFRTTIAAGTITERMRITATGVVQISGSVNSSGSFSLSGSLSTSGSISNVGQSVLFTPRMVATSPSQSFFNITGSLQNTGSTIGSQVYGVNINPLMIYATGSQTQTAFRVAPQFSGSSAFTSSQSNIVADFGAVGVGTQFSVNDITSGSIYLVNDISGLPIIEALSDWTVNMYNYPTKIFQKTGSAIIISGSLNVSGSINVSTGSLTLTSGSITMPNRPAFRVTGSGDATSATTTLSGSMTGVDYNQGNAWNNTTGVFTAPIAGLYQVNIVARTNSNSLGTISQVIVYKNDTNAQIMIEWAANTTTNHIGGSTISKLAVGDTLKAVVSAGTISFDLNDNFSVAYIG